MRDQNAVILRCAQDLVGDMILHTWPYRFWVISDFGRYFQKFEKVAGFVTNICRILTVTLLGLRAVVACFYRNC